jgi:hypothetical protein
MRTLWCRVLPYVIMLLLYNHDMLMSPAPSPGPHAYLVLSGVIIVLSYVIMYYHDMLTFLAPTPGPHAYLVVCVVSLLCYHCVIICYHGIVMVLSRCYADVSWTITRSACVPCVIKCHHVSQCVIVCYHAGWKPHFVMVLLVL